MGPPTLLGDTDVLNKLEEGADKSSNIVMNNIVKVYEQRLSEFIMIPSYDTFVPLAEDGDIEIPKWHLGVKAENSEFICMVCIYNITIFYLG